MKRISLLVVGLLAAAAAHAQLQPAKQTPESSEQWFPVPRIVTPGKGLATVSGFTAPSDAIVLFDGKNLDSWVSAKDGNGAAPWKVADGILTVLPKSGDIQTKQAFGDYQLHIEWRTPAKVEGSSQGRGNSGIFMQGIYELQVLDSYNNVTYSNGQAGSIYKQTMPLVNASNGPGEWQTYDVVYTAPHFNKDGQMIIPPYITVIHNGVLIQNHTMIQGTTPYVGQPEINPHGRGPIKLQDHNNTTSFRNIWIREL
ncbi:hypothetical protein DYBT9275_00338 [Dyadobacter sp. CECT 9275]|uniref:3-keto-alpha-glucoside-1,2-lyase/3-keto-2-hydroxy-glucal hydratase domain-containing protein n=1 Tax=Dyadobacter helix TaxID=2822344 RepID=A0A916J982_9BACT|nr:DUF1080 domain-containing protein [Dyadobacter sp. CECT 9275]CAG4989667.1 hypothetical protein DYBT9275_00338 [Dyadobacter sp. CECT 9275]